MGAAGACAWTAVSNTDWITVTSGTSGSGNGGVSYSVAANTGTASRTGTLTIAGQTFTVTQQASGGVPGATSLNVPSSANIFSAGRAGTAPMDGTAPPSYSFSAGAGKVLTFQAVTGTVQCGPNPPWAANGPDGLAYPTDIVSYNNISGITHPRRSMFLVGVFLADSLPAAAPARLDFTDDAFTALSPAIGQTFFIGDGLTRAGTGTHQQFAVPSTATRLFLGFADASYFRGNPGAYFDNSGSLAAVFSMTSGGGPVTCTYTLSPTGGQAPAAGGASTVSVGAAGGCAWTAVSNAGWITVTSGASGSGNGAVFYSVAGNTGTASRTGTLAIAGQTFTVSQAGAAAPCDYTISPTSASAPAGGAGGTVSVTTASNCSWTAVSNSNWITVTAGSSGTGSGSVTYSVSANTSTSARAGTLTVAARTFTLTQSGAAAGPAPVLSKGGVVNGADFTASAAPGMMIAIFGSHLAPGVKAATGAPLPATMDGVSVEVIDGQESLRTPLFFISPGQINAQLPFDIASQSVQVSVRTANGQSNTQTVNVTPRCPRLFTKTQDGKGEPIVVHADYTLVSPDSPGKPGEVLILFLTGLGPVDPPVEAGGAGGDGGAAGPLSRVAEPVAVMVGDDKAELLFAGLAPYFVGLYQINFKMPEFPTGTAQPVSILCDRQQSQPGVTLAVRAQPPLTTAAVGPAGGTLQAGGLSVAFPTGAFASAGETAIYRLPGRGDQGELSDVYVLKGLPEDPAAPLEVTLELGRAPESGETLILMSVADGEGVPAETVFLPARVEGSRASATVPASQVSAGKSAGLQNAASRRKGGLVVLRAVGGYHVVSCVDNSRFEIWYQAEGFLDLVFKRPALCELHLAIEAANSKLVDVVGLPWPSRRKWPMRVYLYPFTKGWVFKAPDLERRGQEGSRGAGADAQPLELNSYYLGKLEVLKITAGHELFHLLQNQYDPRIDWDRDWGSPLDAWYWMQEAASTWFEELIAKNPSHIPEAVKEEWDFLASHGLEYPPPSSNPSKEEALPVESHGYGAAMFLHYLVETQGGPSAIGKIFQRRANHPQSPVDAIKRVVGNLSGAWDDFCERWMARKVYSSPFPPLDVMSGRFVNVAPIKLTGQPGKWEQLWMVADLSCIVRKISLPSAWPGGAKLKLRLDDSGGAARAILYQGRVSAKFQDWNYRRTFQGEIEIQDAATLAQAGFDLYLLVINSRAVSPYDWIVNVRLTVTVERPGILTEMVNKSITIRASISGKFKCVSTGGVLNPTEMIAGTGLYQPGPFVLKWSGATVSAGGSGRAYNGWYEDVQAYAVFSTDGSRVLRVTFSDREYDATFERKAELTVSGLDFTQEVQTTRDTANYLFFAEGPGARSVVQDMKYTYDGKSNGKTMTCTDLEWNDTASPPRVLLDVSIRKLAP